MGTDFSSSLRSDLIFGTGSTPGTDDDVADRAFVFFNKVFFILRSLTEWDLLNVFVTLLLESKDIEGRLFIFVLLVFGLFLLSSSSKSEPLSLEDEEELEEEAEDEELLALKDGSVLLLKFDFLFFNLFVLEALVEDVPVAEEAFFEDVDEQLDEDEVDDDDPEEEEELSESESEEEDELEEELDEELTDKGSTFTVTPDEPLVSPFLFTAAAAALNCFGEISSHLSFKLLRSNRNTSIISSSSVDISP